MEQIGINDNLVSYSDRNPSKKQTLLFVHGWGSESSVWQHVVGLMGDRYRIVCIDLPGFGASTISNDNMTISDYSNLLDKFIDKKRLENLTVIGHSFGGSVVIKLIANSQKAEIIQKIVLVDSSGIREDTIGLKLKKGIAKIVKPVFLPKFMSGPRRAVYKMIGSEDYVDSGQLKRVYLNIIGEDISSLLGKIMLPTLLIWGDRDEVTPLRYYEKMKSQIKNSEGCIIRGAGHFSFVDQPEVFVKKLKEFIE